MEIMIHNTLLSVLFPLALVLIAHNLANWRLGSACKTAAFDSVWCTPAFIIRRIGLYAAFILGGLALSQNLAEQHDALGSWGAMLDTGPFMEVILGVVSLFAFVFTALRSVDILILSGVKNDDAVIKNNVAVGIVEGGILLSTGFVAFGSLLGEGHILSSWVFFLLGQLVFILFSYMLEYVIHPSHSAKSEIEKGDIPSGIIVAVMLVCVSLFVKNGIAGDFASYAKDIPYFFKVFGIQIAFFMGYIMFIEPLLLKVFRLSPVSIGGAAMRAVLQLGVAVTIVANVSL